MSNNGWISLHRKILEHPFYKEKRKFSKFEAWIDLLLHANHKDNKFILGNELVEVEKGSFITSELKLMERWGWSKTKVRAFLMLLECDSMIVQKKDRKKTTINICNYSVYQGLETEKKPQKDREETVKRPQKDTNNNVNKEINKTIVHQDEHFEHWWNIYNNKKDRKKCEAKFKQLLKKYDYPIIESGTKRYLNHLATLKAKGEFVPQQKNPLTFLNGENFNDDYEVAEAVPQSPNYKPINFDFNRGEE